MIKRKESISRVIKFANILFDYLLRLEEPHGNTERNNTKGKKYSDCPYRCEIRYSHIRVAETIDHPRKWIQ